MSLKERIPSPCLVAGRGVGPLISLRALILLGGKPGLGKRVANTALHIGGGHAGIGRACDRDGHATV